MPPKLIIRQDTGRVTEYPILNDEVKIGRTTSRNDLVLDDLSVSREHAAIRRSGGVFILHDLKSANGSQVNGVFIDAPYTLAPGDVITIGKTTLTFEGPPRGGLETVAKKESGIQFGETHSVDGTIMVSLVPEELLAALKEARNPETSSVTRRPSTAGGVAVVDAAAPAPPADEELSRLQKKAKILALLYELGRTLGTAFSLQEICKKASEMLFSVTPADHCLILMADEQGELKPISVEVSPNLSSDTARPAGDIVISRTITSRVAKEGIALLVYDAQKDFGSESIMMQAIHSVMSAPMMGKQGLIGVIYVDRRDLLSRFEGDDLDLLSAIALQTAIAIEATRARDQLQKEAVVRERLGRFLPAGVVDRVIAGEVQLGGVCQEVTPLFADIRGFTRMSEQTTPEVVVEVLNEHFTIMTDAVVRYGGTLDKYIGDSVMALFGAPTNNPEEDPINAVNAAIEMQQGMKLVNEKLSERSLPNIQIGIGINTGNVVVGEIGSEKQMNYTAIGDAVNLAARLESNAKPGQILVSSTTAERLQGRFALNELPPLTVKGKAEPVRVYEVAWG